MMRMVLAALLVLVLAPSAYGHNGALGLYSDWTLTNCDDVSLIFETDSISLFYVKGQGPDLGKRVEFSIRATSTNVLFSPAPVWSPKIILTVGDIETGISLAAASCMGVNEAVVYLGMIFVFNIGEENTFYVSVMPHPGSGIISITQCDPQDTVVPVLGGAFIFSSFHNVCNVAVAGSSWGAIKSLYR